MRGGNQASLMDSKIKLSRQYNVLKRWIYKYLKSWRKKISTLKKYIRKGEYNKDSWKRFTFNNPCIPKWVFALYVAIHQRQTEQLGYY